MFLDREYAILRVRLCLLIAIVCGLATMGCKPKPSVAPEAPPQAPDSGAAPQGLSAEQSKNKKAAEQKRMQAAIDVLASRTGRPANPLAEAIAKGELGKGQQIMPDRDVLGASMFTRELVEGKRKFAPPFYVVDESDDELGAELVRRNKGMVGEDPKEAGTLVLYWHRATVVGEYAIEGFGSLGKTGEKAVRHDYVVKLIDLRSPWRGRKLTGQREPPSRVQRGNTYASSGGGWSGSIPSTGKSGTVLDDVFDACVGQRDQAGFEPPGERDIGPFYHRHSLPVPDVRLPPHDWELRSIGTSLDEKTLFGVTSDGHLWRWSVPEHKFLSKQKCDRSTVFSADGTLMATGTIFEADSPADTIPITVTAIKDSVVVPLKSLPKFDPNHFSRDPERVLLAGTVRYYVVSSQIHLAAFSADAGYLAAPVYPGVGLWPLKPGNADPYLLIPPLPKEGKSTQPAGAHFLAFTGNGKQLVTLADQYLGIWNVANGIQERVFRIDQGKVTDIVVSQDGNWVGCASADGSIRFWSTATGESLGEVSAGSPVTCLAVTSSGEVLAGCEDGSIKMFAKGKNDPTRVVAFSPGVTRLLVTSDGKRLLSGHTDGNIHRWELATGRRLD